MWAAVVAHVGGEEREDGENRLKKVDQLVRVKKTAESTPSKDDMTVNREFCSEQIFPEMYQVTTKGLTQEMERFCPE